MGGTTVDRVDVIIVSYNGERHLPRLLAALNRSVGVDARAIVVDNASLDGSVEVARANGAEVYALADNRGYGAAFNFGLVRATSEWVVCANQDIDLPEDSVATLLTAVRTQEQRTGRPCVAGPAIVSTTGALLESGHRTPSFWRQTVGLLVSGRVAGTRNHVDRASTTPALCDWVSGVFLTGRRETFAAVGGFDERYFMYVEEVDLFDRLRRVGVDCLWVPGASVTHDRGVRPVPADIYAHALLNWSQYFETRRGRAAGDIVFLAAVGGALARAAIWQVRAALGSRDAPRYAKTFYGAARRARQLRTDRRRQPVA
jgi:N-acetylglucosaminyl-diphospho-decaprenol L-rhamnosyltransferase